jgi:hypothetical protein
MIRDVGFGHLYVNADPKAVADGVARHLEEKGFRRFAMTAERHPRRMKEIRESAMRLYWVSPRLGKWTGVHEFRYYDNEGRERWGYTDEELALALSRTAGEVWRIEALDGAGFWLYAHYVDGAEREGKAYQDTPAERTLDRSHPRYELNAIVEREGFRNLGVGYEHIPGPQVLPLENVPQDPGGIEGLDGFAHLAFEHP